MCPGVQGVSRDFLSVHFMSIKCHLLAMEQWDVTHAHVLRTERDGWSWCQGSNCLSCLILEYETVLHDIHRQAE